VTRDEESVRSALETCAQNDPGSEHWSQASFVGRLTEEGFFDDDLYHALEQAMVSVCREHPTTAAIWSLLRTLERVTLLTGSHFDPTDVYRIGNLDDERVAEFNNRFRFLLRELSFQQLTTDSLNETRQKR
jgi:hypothetical protein